MNLCYYNLSLYYPRIISTQPNTSSAQNPVPANPQPAVATAAGADVAQAQKQPLTTQLPPIQKEPEKPKKAENPFLSDSPSDSGGSNIVNIFMGLAVVAAMCVFSYMFVIVPKQVDGESMEPNFHNGEIVLTNRTVQILGKEGGYERGEVIVFAQPEQPTLIKRIIALPGETIKVQNSQVYVNGQVLNETYLPEGLDTDANDFLKEGQEQTVPEEQYAAFGDNRPASRDSRTSSIGFISREHIKGRVFFLLWPPNRIQWINRGEY